MVIFAVDVVSETNEIVSISNSHYSLRINLGLREEMFQNIADSIAKSRVEAVQNKVREGFRDSVNLAFKIVTKYYIG